MSKELTTLQSSEILCKNLTLGWEDRYPWGQPGFERIVTSSGTVAFCLGKPFPILSTEHISVMFYGKNDKLSIATSSCLPAFSTLDSLYFVCTEMGLKLSDVLDTVSQNADCRKFIEAIKDVIISLCGSDD